MATRRLTVGEAAEERAKAAEMKQPLKVEIYGGELSITIGLDTLAFAVQQGFHWEPDRFTISDPEEFAKDVLRQLEREDESGSTMVHRMLEMVELARETPGFAFGILRRIVAINKAKEASAP